MSEGRPGFRWVHFPGKPERVHRDQKIGLAALALLSTGGLLGIEVASKWLSSDARAVRDCEPTYWSCQSLVTGRARHRALEGTKPSFEGEAWACAEHKAWELAVFRAKFDCQVSARVEAGSCEELETECELVGGSQRRSGSASGRAGR